MLRTHVTKWIIQELNNYIVKERYYAIVMGDFNAIFNPKIDRNSTQEVESRIDQIWVSDNLADLIFCVDIIPSDLESHSDYAYAIAEIEDIILKYTKSIIYSDKILNKIEFNFKGTSEKK
ncbi:11663_t:CDS:2 [Diversispora eburnea]|uniref:11663_t:CDS:1 n=1 Tax=Diversispora eburnea TaxID=1213867 RepID=A0A9N9G092_9GLOM|nr:11663_t:CDS:2 [Diversispora eburnea]